MGTTSPLQHQRELLVRWQTNCQRSAVANYDAANVSARKNYLLGVPAILFSAIVGTSVFAALVENEVSPVIQVFVGLVSMLAAVLSALQTFFNWGEVSSKHQAAAAEYNALKRRIDQILVFSQDGQAINEEEFDRIRSQMDTLARDTPTLPASIWARARRNIPIARDQAASEAA